MAGDGVTAARDWFARESAGAPVTLRERAGRLFESQPLTGDVARDLAAASSRALASALAGPADRSAALDLLAADALVTLALKARAMLAPGELAAFAATLRTSGAAIR
jgi:hypothetical protein